MALYCIVCHCIARNGVVWCCMAWWSWCCMVWQRIALHRLYGVALYVMVWHSIAWFAVLFVHEHCCWDSRFGVLPRRAITLFFISGVDDIFVRNDMWNGAYFWNREDLPDEWEGIFSFSEPELEPIVLPVTAKTDVFWLKDLAPS